MIYSVWNQADQAYHYYQTPGGDAETHAGRPKHLRQTPLGLAPEEAAWPLPSGARYVGRGEQPCGYIASSRSDGLRNAGTALGILPFDLTIPNLVVLGGLAFVAYRWWQKHGR